MHRQCCGRRAFFIVRAGRVDGELKFLAVGRDHGRAGIGGPVGALGVDDHGHACFCGGGHRGAEHAIRQRALAVVRQHDRAAVIRQVFQRGDEAILGDARDGRGLFAVDADDLVLPAHVTRLDRGGPSRLGDEVDVDAVRHVRENAGEGGGRRIAAGEADQRGAAAEGGDVGGHVGRAACRPAF